MGTVLIFSFSSKLQRENSLKKSLLELIQIQIQIRLFDNVEKIDENIK